MEMRSETGEYVSEEIGTAYEIRRREGSRQNPRARSQGEVGMGENDSKTSGRRNASFPSPNFLSPRRIKWVERREQRRQL